LTLYGQFGYGDCGEQCKARFIVPKTFEKLPYVLEDTCAYERLVSNGAIRLVKKRLSRCGHKCALFDLVVE